MAKKKLTLEEKMEEAIVKDAPYDVPRNWIWTKLNVVCDVRDGTHDSPTYIDEGVPLITSKNLKNGEIVFENVNYISEEDHELISKRSKVDEGDILFAMIGTIGNPVLVTNMLTEFSIKNVALFKSRNIISDKFMYYYVQSFMYMKQLEKNLKGSTQKFIALGKLRESYVALPPLKEQQRIVDIIESLFEKLDKANELIEEARVGFEKRKTAILEKAFRGELTKGLKKVEATFDFNIEFDEVEDKYVKEVKSKWSFCRVRDIAYVKGGKRLPKGEKLVIDNTGYPYLRAGNLKNQSVLEEDIQYLTEEVQRRIKNYIITSSDVYITIVGACIGDVGVIPDKLSGANLTENAAKICNINKEVINKTFLMKWLSSLTGQYLIKDNVLSATLGKLALTRIKEILIPLPSLEEQKEIVRILDNLLEEESKIEELTTLEDQIELIKKSILAKAFRGELGTNDLNEESALELLKEILRKNNT
ncbi:restriction endonuclease subunit S [Clostridium botulinum]|uniref:restriction endonuclease subunit S n=1 Tax=Clostridium botulinum TaxID=1491 RepID=UPI00077344BE|nr:restriction endonuclease subunit S [Clostridium botulinum]NFE95953.1 hypothetical protein [Clostridium botulinum]NFL39436.1 hypothetical protein [Clostridium botulinum]NFL65055.1 hypothetical protein [Clostridium botulinum]NFN09275.1 hypothetical protein [Clostridium botulinum]NFN25903.1 hypothetical protein [Clostridium botulinum]